MCSLEQYEDRKPGEAEGGGPLGIYRSVPRMGALTDHHSFCGTKLRPGLEGREALLLAVR